MAIGRNPVLTAVAAGVLLFGCSNGTGPSAPSVPALPAAPTPVPTATPEPIPGYSAMCSVMGYAPGGADCEQGASEYLGLVEEAVDKTIDEHQAWFNLKYELGYRGFKVLEPDLYLDAVVARLSSLGLCAAMDPRREYLKIKKTNAMAETFEILHPKDFVERKYLQTCHPADFPARAEDVIARIRVGFFGFRCPEGEPKPPPYMGVLPLRCEGLATATPKDNAGKDVPASIHGPEIFWELSQGEDVVATFPSGEQPFNRMVRPFQKGRFGLCATVKGVTGCLDGKVIERW